MDNIFEAYKKNFTRDIFYDKERISSEEYQSLPPEEKSKCICEPNMGELFYYRKLPIELTDEQLNILIQIKTYKVIQDTNEKVSTIKFIMVCSFVISIIGFFLSLLTIK